MILEMAADALGDRLAFGSRAHGLTYEQLRLTVDVEQATQMIIQMNDILVNEVVMIPEVNRAADKYAISNRLNNENVGLSALEGNFWNIANWVTVE